MAKWQGPFKVRRKVGPVDYQIEMPSRQQPLQVFHVNLLKKWHDRALRSEPTVVSKQQLLVRGVYRRAEEQYLPVQQDESSLDLQHLSADQRGQLLDSIPQQLFRNSPGKTDLVQHRIYLKDDKPIHQHLDELIEKLSNAQFLTTLDLCKAIGRFP